MSDTEGYRIALQLIAKEAEEKTGVLDRGMLSLTEIPPEINELDHLQVLNLGRRYVDIRGNFHFSSNTLRSNNFASAISNEIAIKGLRILSYDQCTVRDISTISCLPELEHLNLLHSKTEDIGPVVYCTKLKYLRCDYCEIKDFTPLINLTRLHTLSAFTEEYSDFSPIEEVVTLRSCLKNLSPSTETQIGLARKA